MAVAGKVAITLSTENGGAWSADVTYDRLVAVKYNNNLYISRKTVANVEPPNDEFWFLALEGFGGEDVEALIDRMNELSGLIQAIIDGSTQVGNALTLDGHEAEDFFPKSGGTVNGDVTVEKTSNGANVSKYLKNLVREIREYIGGSGVYRLHDVTNGKDIITSNLDGTNTFNGTASGNLPLTGGTVTGTNNTPIAVVNGSGTGTASYTRYGNKSEFTGSLGFYKKNEPVFKSEDGTVYNLLHTGNKPTGTYTGNGSATARTINTGGIGKACIVYGNGHSFIATPLCTIYANYNSNAVSSLKQTEYTFNDGKIGIATDGVANANGATYTYWVL